MAAVTDSIPELSSSVTVCFSANVYALDVVKKAAYKFADVAAAEITTRDNEIVCTLRITNLRIQQDLRQLANDLNMEVLDQDLRATITTETEAFRNAILGYAFSKTGLQGGE